MLAPFGKQNKTGVRADFCPQLPSWCRDGPLFSGVVLLSGGRVGQVAVQGKHVFPVCLGISRILLCAGFFLKVVWVGHLPPGSHMIHPPFEKPKNFKLSFKYFFLGFYFFIYLRETWGLIS